MFERYITVSFIVSMTSQKMIMNFHKSILYFMIFASFGISQSIRLQCNPLMAVTLTVNLEKLLKTSCRDAANIFWKNMSPKALTSHEKGPFWGHFLRYFDLLSTGCQNPKKSLKSPTYNLPIIWLLRGIRIIKIIIRCIDLLSP